MFLFQQNTYGDYGLCKGILYLQMQMFWGKQHLFEGPKGQPTQCCADGMGTAVSNKQS